MKKLILILFAILTGCNQKEKITKEPDCRCAEYIKQCIKDTSDVISHLKAMASLSECKKHKEVYEYILSDKGNITKDNPLYQITTETSDK